MANDYFWSQVKKNFTQPQQQSLSEAYRLVKENNVALYTKEIGQETQPPPAPEGTMAFAVVPKDDLNKIRTLSKVRSAGPALKELFQLAGIEEGYFNVVKKSISGAAEDSGYDHVMELLMTASEKKKEGGFFNIQTGEYNLINTLINSIKSTNTELIDNGLAQFLISILSDTPKYAPTNIGPGEFFCILFTDARAAEGAGDIETSNSKIEVKASGARLGGGAQRHANHASLNIIKYLSSKKFTYQQSEFFEDEKNEVANVISNIIEKNVSGYNRLSLQSLMQDVKTALNTTRYHRQVVAKFFTKNLLGRVEDIINDINNPTENKGKYFQPGSQPPNLMSAVDARSGRIVPNGGRKTTTVTLAQYLQDQLNREKESFFSRKSTDKSDLKEDVEANVSGERNLAYLLKNTFNAIKSNPNKKTIQLTDLINLILYTNSYSPEELQEYGYDITSELTSFLQSKGVDGVLNMSTGAIVDLIGGMHLISYAKEANFDQFMLLDKQSGKTINVETPQNLTEAIQFCLRPDVKIGPEVDHPEGTIRASTASFYITS